MVHIVSLLPPLIPHSESIFQKGADQTESSYMWQNMLAFSKNLWETWRMVFLIYSLIDLYMQINLLILLLIFVKRVIFNLLDFCLVVYLFEKFVYDISTLQWILILLYIIRFNCTVIALYLANYDVFTLPNWDKYHHVYYLLRIIFDKQNLYWISLFLFHVTHTKSTPLHMT